MRKVTLKPMEKKDEYFYFYISAMGISVFIY